MHGLFLALFLHSCPSDGVEAVLKRASAGLHWYEGKGNYADGVRYGMWIQGAWVGVARDKLVFHRVEPQGGEGAGFELRFDGAEPSELTGIGPEPGVTVRGIRSTRRPADLVHHRAVI